MTAGPRQTEKAAFILIRLGAPRKHDAVREGFLQVMVLRLLSSAPQVDKRSDDGFAGRGLSLCKGPGASAVGSGRS